MSQPATAAQPLAVAITTVARPRDAECERARQLAAETGYSYVSRDRRPLAKIAMAAQCDGLLVVERGDLALWIDGESLRHHPNMAKLRILAIEQGRGDVLVDALQLKPGDRVLDCTCGLGADAIVTACAVGPGGRVRALEAAPLLALLVSRGMAASAVAEPPALEAAMRRVEVARAEYGNFLRGEANDAWDVVYFDPMFATTVAAARGLDMVRRLARAGGPTSADIDQARRVARRRVVMKDRLPGPELERLGFTAIHQGRRVCYGALDAL